MGKAFKDSYASNYAAKNVKKAIDKLIDVLQSPEHVRQLVLAPVAKKPQAKPGKISFETPAMTPPRMETTNDVTEQTTRNADSDAPNRVTPPLSANLSDEKKRTSSSGGSRASEVSECSDSSWHTPHAKHTQIWKKSLRNYPERSSCRPRDRQQSASPRLEATWSSVACKSGDFSFAC